MRRAKKLGSVEFQKGTLFIDQEFEKDNVSCQVISSAGGTHIVYEAEIKTPYITLQSKEHSYVTDAEKNALELMRSPLRATAILTYDDDSTEEVRFAKETKMSFVPLFEGSKKYRATIPLAKIL